MFVSPAAWIDSATAWLFDNPTAGLGRAWPKNYGRAAASHLGGIGLFLALAAVTARGSWRIKLGRFSLILACVGMWLVVSAALYKGGLKAVPTVEQMQTGKIWDDVWMPRYLGTIVPAVLIVLATLFRRLPMATLRYGAVALFVMFNLAQFGGRVYAGSEAPTDKFVADIVASQSDSAKFRAYTELTRRRSSTPASGMMGSAPYAYYLAVTGPAKITSRVGWLGRAQDDVTIRSRTLASYVARDIRVSPTVERFAIWDAYEADDPPTIGGRDDPKLAAVARRVREEVYPVRDHWMWLPRLWVVRREYVRVGQVDLRK